MTNRPTSPGVKINLDGKEYAFRLDFTAMADFEEITGKNVLEMVGQIFGRIQNAGAGEGLATVSMADLLLGIEIDAADLRALLWACLGGDDSGLDLRAAGRLVHPGNMQDVVLALTQAISSALPEPGEDGQGDPPAVVQGGGGSAG